MLFFNAKIIYSLPFPWSLKTKVHYPKRLSASHKGINESFPWIRNTLGFRIADSQKWAVTPYESVIGKGLLIFFVQSWLPDTIASCFTFLHMVLSEGLFIFSLDISEYRPSLARWYQSLGPAWKGGLTMMWSKANKKAKAKDEKKSKRKPHFSHCGTKMLHAEFSLSD